MLMGLKEGQDKMSKSDPDSAIFMEDTAVWLFVRMPARTFA
jgi:tyrosyl-tRNA synthetase